MVQPALEQANILWFLIKKILKKMLGFLIFFILFTQVNVFKASEKSKKLYISVK
jgi:hypothetical protein